MFEQCLEIASIFRINCHPQRTGRGTFHAIDLERCRQCIDHLGSQRRHRNLIRLTGSDNQKFIATLPADRVGSAHGLPQAASDLNNERVTGAMAERIVDSFKMVQIQKQ